VASLARHTCLTDSEMVTLINTDSIKQEEHTNRNKTKEIKER
jgi:hypothetical protein